MILAGAILALNGSTEPAIAGPATTSPAASGESTPTTTRLPETTAPGSTSTTVASTTTAVATTTTTTAAPTETVQEFVELYAAAIANGDADFVLSRLHPQVVEQLSIDVCQSWVATEIMALSDYEMAGEPTEPQNRDFSIAGSPVRIDNVSSVPVSFTFGGQSFDSTADFALLDGVIYWLGTCE